MPKSESRGKTRMMHYFASKTPGNEFSAVGAITMNTWRTMP